MLTEKQHELLMFIHEKLSEKGIPPSFDEMKDALELKSKSGIHRLITALEERGFIRRLPNRARALEVIRLPDGFQAPSAGSAIAADPAISGRAMAGQAMASQHERVGMIAANDDAPGFASVPVMGRIAAGTPISAIAQETHSIAVSPEMLGGGEHYALEVKGDSMIEAGILDGDTVVIRHSNTADIGDIVVALVDDEEATLKRFRRNSGKIELEAANPAYENQILEPHRVNVQGKLVGLIRRYN